MNSLFWFACMRTSALPIKLSLPQPTSFLTFILPVLSPIPSVGEWASGCLGLSCRLASNYDRTQRRTVNDTSRSKQNPVGRQGWGRCGPGAAGRVRSSDLQSADAQLPLGSGRTVRAAVPWDSTKRQVWEREIGWKGRFWKQQLCSFLYKKKLVGRTQCTQKYNRSGSSRGRDIFFFLAIASRTSQTTSLIQRKATENSLIIISLPFHYELFQGVIHFEIHQPLTVSSNPGWLPYCVTSTFAQDWWLFHNQWIIAGYFFDILYFNHSCYHLRIIRRLGRHSDRKY